MSPTSEIFGWAILVATLIGPVSAVIVTIYIEKLREQKRRKLWLFRDLMANRRANPSKPFVDALNLVEIEFHENQKVKENWRELMDSFNINTTNYNEAQHQMLAEKRETKIANLLVEIGRALGYNMPQLDVLRGGYIPQGWGWKEEREDAISRFFAEVATGRNSLPMHLVVGAEEEAAKRALHQIVNGERSLRVVLDRKADSE